MFVNRLADAISVLRFGQLRADVEADRDFTHRNVARLDGELAKLRERMDRQERAGGESEGRCVARLTRHIEEHHVRQEVSP